MSSQVVKIHRASVVAFSRHDSSTNSPRTPRAESELLGSASTNASVALNDAFFARSDTREVRWDGQSIHVLADSWRRQLLYIGHDSGLQGMLSARENLRVASALAGSHPSDAEITAALSQLGLTSRADLPARFLSQGQKRRAALARLVGSRATVWVLDEPFVAIDGEALQVLSALIAAHLGRGGLAVLTSHQPVNIPGRAGQMLELAR